MPVVPHFLDIFRAETFLRIREAISRRMFFAEEVLYQRLHTAPGEEGRRVVVRDQGRRRYDGVPALLEEFQILTSNFVDGHNERLYQAAAACPPFTARLLAFSRSASTIERGAKDVTVS